MAGQPVSIYHSNGKPFNSRNPLYTKNEEIVSLKRVNVDISTAGIKNVEVPEGAYTVIFKRCFVEDAEAIFNGEVDHPYPIMESDVVGPWKELNSLQIKVVTPSTVQPMVLIFNCYE